MKYLLLVLTILLLSFPSVAQWTQIGPDGGPVFDLERVDGEIWMATSGGLFTSSDDGESWQETDVIPPSLFVHSVQEFDGDVFIATSRSDINIHGQFRRGAFEIFRRLDGETEFEKFTLQQFNNYGLDVESMYYSGLVKHKDALYVHYGSSFWVSLDNGASWNEPDQNAPGFVRQFYSSENTLVLSNFIEAWYSTDGGVNWTTIPSSTEHYISLMSGDTLFRNTSTISYSTDFGQTWIPTPYFSNLSTFNSRDVLEFDESLRLFKSDPRNTLIASGLNTVDRLTNLSEIGSIHTCLKTNNGDYLIGTSLGVFKVNSSNQSPRPTHQDVQVEEIDNLFVSPENNLYRTTDGILFRSVDQGVRWDTITDDISIGGQNQIVWTGTTDQTFRIYKDYNFLVTTDGGQTFTRKSIEYPGFNVSEWDYTPTRIYGSRNDEVMYTEDDGTTWISIHSSVPGSFPTFYNAGSFQLLLGSDGITITRNDGQTWDHIYNDRANSSKGGCFSIGAEHIVVLGNFDNELLISRDDGITWALVEWPVGLPLDQYRGSPLFENIFKIGDDYYVHALMNGIFVSDSLQGPYTPLNEGMDNPNTLVARYTDEPNIFLGTMNGSIWRHGASFNRIEGVVFDDDNGDQQFGTDESPVQGALITSFPNGLNAASRADGTYTLLASAWGDTLRPTLTFPYAIPTPEYHVATAATGPFDYAVTYESDKNDLAVRLVTGLHRPGFPTYVSLSVENMGSTDIPADYYIVAPNGVTLEPRWGTFRVSGDTTFMSFSTLASHETKQKRFDILVDPNVPLTTELCYHAGVTSIFQPDENLADNTTSSCETVVGSYDPNDKQVDPAILDPAQPFGETRLNYTVRFQNTGTYLAEDVEIRDQLSPKLDLSTLRIDAVSHEPYTMSIDDGRNLVIRFEDIMLPDSTSNEPESHGFVRFSILPKEVLELGDQIQNTARIYFDFNEAIVTNTVLTTSATISSTTSVLSLGALSFYPNPARDVVRIVFPQQLTGTAQLEVHDLSGKLLQKSSIDVENDSIDYSLGQLPGGQYQLSIQGQDVQFTGQLSVVR